MSFGEFIFLLVVAAICGSIDFISCMGLVCPLKKSPTVGIGLRPIRQVLPT